MGSFDGVAEVYDKWRHGYPSELRDHLVEVGALGPDSSVLDLGAGTGQLATMAATVTSTVVAMDPEADMVRVGQHATKDEPSIRWLVGGDRDVLQIVDPQVDLVLIGNAFHHMDQSDLLRDLDVLVSPTGTVVVCSTSTPVWLQDTDWSAALRVAVGQELGRPVDGSGTPDHDADRSTLSASPFSNVETWIYERPHQRSADSVIGEVVSSASGAIDGPAAERLRSTLSPFLSHGAVTESVKTTAVIARR